jgi:hypothetical protein
MKTVTSIKRHTCTNLRMIYQWIDILFVCKYLHKKQTIDDHTYCTKKKKLLAIFLKYEQKGWCP